MDEGIGGIGGGGGGGCKAVLAVSASYCCVMANQTVQPSQTGISALHNREHSTYTTLHSGLWSQWRKFTSIPTTPPHIWDHTIALY